MFLALRELSVNTPLWQRINLEMVTEGGLEFWPTDKTDRSVMVNIHWHWHNCIPGIKRMDRHVSCEPVAIANPQSAMAPWEQLEWEITDSENSYWSMGWRYWSKSVTVGAKPDYPLYLEPYASRRRDLVSSHHRNRLRIGLKRSLVLNQFHELQS